MVDQEQFLHLFVPSQSIVLYTFESDLLASNSWQMKANYDEELVIACFLRSRRHSNQVHGPFMTDWHRAQTQISTALIKWSKYESFPKHLLK